MTGEGRHMSGESGDVTARCYHTENGNAHAEGETYSVIDAALLETLRGCGFVSIVGWTPDPPPVEPPPDARRDDGRGSALPPPRGAGRPIGSPRDR